MYMFLFTKFHLFITKFSDVEYNTVTFFVHRWYAALFCMQLVKDINLYNAITERLFKRTYYCLCAFKMLYLIIHED